MKRRTFIIGAPLITAGAILSYSTYKWINRNIDPDFKYLLQSKAVLASLADTIIPKTNSPSASECGVHEFIIKMIIDCTETKEQNTFIQGLKEVETYSKTTYKKSFSLCLESEQIAILNYFDQKDESLSGMAGKGQRKFLGKSFFFILKEYCIWGYFTSEQGATQALRYAHVPGHYTACERYTDGEKAWATN